MRPENIGSTQDELLREDGTYERVTANAVARPYAKVDG
jgi:hypothetical protein